VIDIFLLVFATGKLILIVSVKNFNYRLASDQKLPFSARRGSLSQEIVFWVLIAKFL
jgi:hypothetical protein